MKKIIIMIYSITVAIAVFVIMHQQKISDSNVIRIAVFTPTTHPALEEIEQGFKETLQTLSAKSYAFTTYNANGNRTLLRAQAEEIVQGSYDVICTLGAMCSQTIAELLHKRGVLTPHVFCAIDGAEFAHTLMHLNPSSTGVYVQLDYTKEMDMLHAIKPDTKNILLVYDPTHGTGLEKYKHQIEQHVKKFGMTLHSVQIYQSNEIQQKVAALVPTVDVVLVLIDNTVVAGIDALIALCNRFGVTLLASDLASGKKGAALAYGITEYESGSGAAHKAHEIVDLGKKPQELPISAITNFTLAINRQTQQAQHLAVDETLVKQYER